MGCGGCRSKKKPQCPKKRKRLPSINPFFHFLKCVWRKLRGCKRSVVVRYAVKKWRRMTPAEKQPFYDAACRAQALHRAAKKNDGSNNNDNNNNNNNNNDKGSSKGCAKPKAKCVKKKKKNDKKQSCPKC